MVETQTVPTQTSSKTERPKYMKPTVQIMTEREILNTFQITQAMTTWWVAC